MENKKIGFFSRVKIAVAKLENYSIFLEEKLSIAVKYFFLIVLILSIVMSVIQTYSMMRVIEKGYQYVQNELPEFSYEDGNLQFSERIFAYDEEYDIYMIADTGDEITEDVLQQYKDDIKTTGLIFLKDKVIYQSGDANVEYDYNNLSEQYQITSIDKAQLIEEINKIGMMGIAVTVFILALIGIFIAQMISIFMDWLMISLFTFIVARVCRIHMNFKHCFNISIYTLTLSIILSMFYQIAYTLTGFYIEYFRLVYLLIAYVYVVAVILMIKSDLLKQQVEVAKIVEVQKEVQNELDYPGDEQPEDKQEKKQPEKDDNGQKKDTDEENVSGQPDGSEI